MNTRKRLKKWKHREGILHGNPENSLKMNDLGQLLLTTLFKITMWSIGRMPKSFARSVITGLVLSVKLFGSEKRAPHTMNRDEGAHYLSHIYDPLLTSSTSSRAPPCGDRRKQKLDQPSQFWWSALPESTKLSIVSQLFGFGKWISLY